MPDQQRPHADRSVRRALPADAEVIARIQGGAWREAYGPLLPEEAAGSFDVAAAAVAWREAIEAPPTSRHRVLVALDASEVVGFAASGPGSDADLDAAHDGELLALHVAADHQRQGHGSRLMAAVADHAHDDGLSRLVCWVFAADDPMRVFLRSAGWEPDGSTRDLDVGELLHQVRLHTILRDHPHLIA